jgi:hypothetical protein
MLPRLHIPMDYVAPVAYSFSLLKENVHVIIILYL